MFKAVDASLDHATKDLPSPTAADLTFRPELVRGEEGWAGYDDEQPNTDSSND